MYVFQALILQERKMVHSKNSFLLGRLVSFHCCWFKKKKKVGSIEMTSSSPWQGLALPCPSLLGCSAPQPPGTAPCAQSSFLFYSQERYDFSGLSSEASNPMSGHHTSFLLICGCPQFNAEEA